MEVTSTQTIMKWFVYYYNINNNKIETLNIFSHSRFADEVKKHLKSTVKAEFAEAVRGSLFRYYCSKAEYEVLVSAWCGGDDSIKVDVYNQVRLNWDVFIEYLWSFKEKKERRK